jgi:hypothetical protein
MPLEDQRGRVGRVARGTRDWAGRTGEDGAHPRALVLLVKELSSRMPGANVINAAVAGALTGALGEAYVRLCAEMLRRRAAGRPMPDPEMIDFLMDMHGSLLRKRV